MSTLFGAQGNSECFQVVAHKNLDGFDRRVFLPGALFASQGGGAERAA